MNPLPASLFPHPNFSDEVNRKIVQSEIEGGVFLEDLTPSTILEIETRHHRYSAVVLGGSQVLICGHPEYCPQPVQVHICGSTWGGSMLKMRYVGRGMHLEFSHPGYRSPIITSPIKEIRECFQKANARAAELPPVREDTFCLDSRVSSRRAMPPEGRSRKGSLDRADS